MWAEKEKYESIKRRERGMNIPYILLPSWKERDQDSLVKYVKKLKNIGLDTETLKNSIATVEDCKNTIKMLYQKRNETFCSFRAAVLRQIRS